SLQIVALYSPSHELHQAKVDAASEIKREGAIVLTHISDECFAIDALPSCSKEGMRERRYAPNGNRCTWPEEVGVHVGINVNFCRRTKERSQDDRYGSVIATNIGHNADPGEKPNRCRCFPSVQRSSSARAR